MSQHKQIQIIIRDLLEGKEKNYTIFIGGGEFSDSFMSLRLFRAIINQDIVSKCSHTTQSMFEFDTETAIRVEFFQDLLSIRFFMTTSILGMRLYLQVTTPFQYSRLVRPLQRNRCYSLHLETGSFLLPSTTHRYTSILNLKQISFVTYYSKIAFH